MKCENKGSNFEIPGGKGEYSGIRSGVASFAQRSYFGKLVRKFGSGGEKRFPDPQPHKKYQFVQMKGEEGVRVAFLLYVPPQLLA